MKRNDSLVEALLELQNLDRVPRMGFSLRGVTEPESVAEHSFHVATLVWTLAVEEPELDPHRALELALVHDMAEVRTGDLPMTATRYFGAKVKAVAERSALNELLAPLGARAERCAEEVEARATREARFVKACDKLQLLLKVTAYEHAGNGALDEFWRNEANFPSDEFPAVTRVFGELKSLRASLGLA
jgi:putative hydrolase of HD superfamily